MSSALAFEEPSLPKGERRRRQILEATLRVIADGGVDAVTHRRVAAEAGTSAGSTTYHFDSRDQLVREAFRFLIEIRTRELALLGSDLESPTLDDFIDLTVEHVESEIADRESFRAGFELLLEASRDEELARAYWGWQRSIEAQAAERLQLVGCRDTFETATLITSLVRAYELERLTHRQIGPNELKRRLRIALAGSQGE